MCDKEQGDGIDEDELESAAARDSVLWPQVADVQHWQPPKYLGTIEVPNTAAGS